MASRYGRNQRRAARARVAELEAALSAAKSNEARAIGERYAALARLRNAREEVLQEYIEKHDMIKAAMDDIGYELAKAFPAHVMPHVEKLMAAHRDSRRKPLVVSASVVDRERTVTTIRGEIPALNYNIAVF